MTYTLKYKNIYIVLFTSIGLILYNGRQQSDQNPRKGDFMCFGIREGYPEFRYDLGSGVVEINAKKPLEVGKWHTIKLERYV